MTFVFHPDALEEYSVSTTYYHKISAQLAEAFVQSVEKGIEQICANPETWGLVDEGVRRYLIKRFPFGIYYAIEADYILIVAVMHMSRKPEYWKNRL